MARYIRTFHCKKCKRQAKLDFQDNHFALIRCEKCGQTEGWGQDDVLKKLEFFNFQDIEFGAA